MGNSEELSVFGYNGSGEAHDLLEWALAGFHPDIALACSFQNPVLIHMMNEISPEARVFAIDTGRMNEETYECARAIEERFKIQIEWYFPKHDAVERLVREKGQFSFRKSLAERRECCQVRKVEPLNRALSGLKAWVTGVRREQSSNREDVCKIEQDDAHGGLLKINPLTDWSAVDVREYVDKYNLPYNSLMDQGYTSVGCEPCTRSVKSGDHPRSGRWWWELSDHKECGLHVRDWNI